MASSSNRAASIRSRAPGKLVALGEYAVLAGAPALVLAVNRHCRVEIAPSADRFCHLLVLAPGPYERRFAPGELAGVPLVDCVLKAWPQSVSAWCATIDSRPLYQGEQKLGLGSSAAALCAWGGAYKHYLEERSDADLCALIALHREFQGGGGSGLDVAASFTGGVISYQLMDSKPPLIGSVQLPKGVGFAGVFAGRSASTPDLLAIFDQWRVRQPQRAEGELDGLRSVAEAGCEALQRGDALGFLSAVAEYGDRLAHMGSAMGADIVTAEHVEIGRVARRHGIAYKVSGAGGGDVGLAFSADPAALQAFERALDEKRYTVVGLEVDLQGLVVKELTE